MACVVANGIALFRCTVGSAWCEASAHLGRMEWWMVYLIYARMHFSRAMNAAWVHKTNHSVRASRRRHTPSQHRFKFAVQRNTLPAFTRVSLAVQSFSSNNVQTSEDIMASSWFSFFASPLFLIAFHLQENYHVEFTGKQFKTRLINAWIGYR